MLIVNNNNSADALSRQVNGNPKVIVKLMKNENFMKKVAGEINTSQITDLVKNKEFCNAFIKEALNREDIIKNQDTIDLIVFSMRKNMSFNDVNNKIQASLFKCGKDAVIEKSTQIISGAQDSFTGAINYATEQLTNSALNCATEQLTNSTVNYVPERWMTKNI